ncbi:helix-turn-helix transcriptional regulator [Streptomyces sp. HNM0663]|uniref:Helix-turn-helix transcriptional regulator n=1 Tax=Streptomyces chengmaiensis TaxID=3040919 RepID=A0ABT6I0I1_9ACTN|nr:helix-turn-helix transcriptional regulator [Streptomyces chengmaiensis]MDH2394128.1 helix-turn-helix transcriptional regulator [Streptomyces chengmaiensis]
MSGKEIAGCAERWCMVEAGYGLCGYCRRRFEQRTGRGRRRQYCTVKCRRQAQREREGRLPTQPAASPLGRSLAEDLQAMAARLLAAEYGGQELETLLRHAGDLAREVECYRAAAVHDARVSGTGWEAVAKAARVSVPTARLRWNGEQVRRAMDRRARQRARAAEVVADGAGAAEAGGGERAVTGSKRLTSALSYLHRASRLPIREVAQHTGLSASYVSRILSGERLPSWPVMVSLVKAFGGDPAHLSALWESSHGVCVPARQAFPQQLARLRAALWGLYLAAARPGVAHLCRIQPGALTPESVEDLLSGDVLPDWETTGAFVSALGAGPAEIRPLWEEAHYAFLVWVHPMPDAAPGGMEADGAAGGGCRCRR